jgi:histone H3/H4
MLLDQQPVRRITKIVSADTRISAEAAPICERALGRRQFSLLFLETTMTTRRIGM